MAFRQRVPEGQRRVYEHDEIEVEYRGVKVKINKNGTVTFRKDVNSEEFDEITVPANAIFRTASLLNNTKKIKMESTNATESRGTKEDSGT